MNDYYLTLVLKPDLEEKAKTTLLDEVKKKLTREDGKITKEDLWGAKNLSYAIKKQTKGFYVHFEFSLVPALAKDLDKSLKVEEDILRYLLVRV